MTVLITTSVSHCKQEVPGRCPARAADIQEKLSLVIAPLYLSDQGSTYVRWGKTSCGGNGTEKVYSGKFRNERSDRTRFPPIYS